MPNIEKINAIKDEVKEFHPLIRDLFNAHPNITNVKYTHGNNEFGADFVLTKQDEITLGEQYIGVIVKTKPIKQDSDDVLRQIDECNISRFSDNGKKDVFLNEIYIITSQNITSNAEKIIHEKFRTKNISFIDAQQLERMILKYLPDYFSEFDLALTPYLQNLQKEMETQDIELNLLSKNGQSFYIEQNLRIIEKGYKQKPTFHKQKDYNILELVNKHDSLYIGGVIGSGKSRLVRNLSKLLCKHENYEMYSIVPIYYNADIFYKEGFFEDLDDYTSKFREKHKIQDNISILLIIDGIDEIKISNDQKFSLIESLGKYSNPKCKIIITSRNISDIDNTNIIETYYTHCNINLLSMRQVYNFIEKICTELDVSNRLYEDLKKSTLFSMIPKTPIAAILLGQLLNQNIELPSTLTELYQKYTELALGRWDTSKGFKNGKEYEVSSKIITELSFYMMSNSIHEIAYDELKYHINHYLETRNLLPTLSAVTILDFIEKRCDILFFNTNKSTISFKHRSFMEFFYAKAMIEKNNIEISDDIFSPYLSAAYFFLIGLKKDCSELLESIISICPIEDKFRFLKILNMGNYLMAGYLTPYNVVSAGIKNVFLEASYYINDLIKGKLHNPLINFSEMQILAFFKSIVYAYYSYEFFHKAIEEAMLTTISDKEIPEDVKGIMLFYLNVSLIDLKKDNLFDELVASYYESLPYSIRLAIRHEVKENKLKKSKALLKAMKKIQDSFSGDKSKRNEKLTNIYDKPIALTRAKELEGKKGKVTINN